MTAKQTTETVEMSVGEAQREFEIHPDGTHEGQPIKRINPETDTVTVLCPAGHFHAEIPVRLKDSYYTGKVSCEGALSRDRFD